MRNNNRYQNKWHPKRNLARLLSTKLLKSKLNLKPNKSQALKDVELSLKRPTNKNLKPAALLEH